MNDFQDSLKDLLEEKGLSRLQLARKLKIGSSTLDGYFNKGYYPTLEIALKMANFFECSVSYLFGLSSSKKYLGKKEDKSFFEIFSQLIKEHDLSIAQGLRLLHMSEYNYFRWKNGMFPKTKNLILISKFFDVSVDFLIGNQWQTKL